MALTWTLIGEKVLWKMDVNHFPQTDRGRIRTCNPQRRKLMPYPLGHTAAFIDASFRPLLMLSYLHSNALIV